MLSNRSFVLLLSFSLLLLSCQEFKETKPSSSSREGEILVIIPNNLWESEIGDSVRYYFESPVAGLGQYEPQLKVYQIQKDELNNLLKISRNILVVHLNDKEHKENPLTVVYNKWAEPQIVLNLYVENEIAFTKMLRKYSSTIINYVNKEELKRKIKSYNSLADKSIQANLKKQFEFYVSIPNGYKWSLSDDQFVWIRNETQKVGQNIWIYKQPIPDKEVTTDLIIEIRNTICKEYIPGPLKGSYMKTAADEFLVYDQVKLNGMEAIRTKGLWDLQGDFMGGPFINYVFEYKNQLIMIEGFVYAPGKTKHRYLKQLNAMINSIEFNQ